MASISKRTDSDGNITYLIQVRLKGAAYYSKVFKTREEAAKEGEEKEEEFRSQMRQRRTPNHKGFNRELLTVALTQYRDKHRSMTKKTRDTITAIIRIVNLMGVKDAPLEVLDEDYAQEYADKMLATVSNRGKLYSAGTVATHFTHLSNALRARAKHYRIPAKLSVFSRNLLPKNFRDSRDRRLSRQEELARFETMRAHPDKHWWRLLVHLALETGARQMELAEAPWLEFDLELRVWNLPKNRTKARIARMIPLSRRAIRILGCLEKLRVDGHPMVFPGLPSGVSQAFAAIRKNAGINDFRFHDIRHEAISRMISRKRKLSVYEILTIVGHNSLEMLRIYHNMRPQDIVDRME